MNFTRYKYEKALFDQGRAHAVLMEASAAARANPADSSVHSHSAFRALDHTLETVRFVADDLLTDIGNCWDVLLDACLDSQKVPEHEATDSGGSRRLSDSERLAILCDRDTSLGSTLSAAKSHLFDRLKDARNAFTHRDFWLNTFKASFPSSGPFLMDLRWDTRYGEIVVLRDARRGIQSLHAMDEGLNLGHDLPAPNDPCDECYADEWIESPRLAERFDQL